MKITEIMKRMVGRHAAPAKEQTAQEEVKSIDPVEPIEQPAEPELTDYQKAARLEYKFLMAMAKPKRQLGQLARCSEAALLQQLAAQQNIYGLANQMAYQNSPVYMGNWKWWLQ